VYFVMPAGHHFPCLTVAIRMLGIARVIGTGGTVGLMQTPKALAFPKLCRTPATPSVSQDDDHSKAEVLERQF
jgi:hypothetical protein